MSQPATVLLNRILARGKFRHVQVLLKLAEFGTVQRAAESIGMTQSAVTQTLAYLERLLETQLFHRHARGVRPMPACIDLLPIARSMLLGIADGAGAIAARHRRGEGVVRVVASTLATNGFLTQALPGFHDRYPAIQIHLRELEGEDLLLAVSRDETDVVAHARAAVLPDGWRFLPLLADRLVVACAANHRLARARHVSWADLARETWLSAPAGSVAREQLDGLASRLRRQPRIYPLATRALMPILWMLRQHGLLAFLPLSFIAHLVEAGELAVVAAGDPMPLEPMGLLVREESSGEATSKFAAFMSDRFPQPPLPRPCPNLQGRPRRAQRR